MSEQDIKLGYNATLLRVRLDVTRRACKERPQAPVKIVEKARMKLDAEKKSGKVRGYITFEDVLISTWAAVRADESLPDDFQVRIPLAQGFPNIPGLTFGPKASEKGLAQITLDVNDKVAAQLRCEWIIAAYQEWAAANNVSGVPNFSQVHALLARLQKGEHVGAIELTAIPASALAPGGKPFSIVASKVRLEVACVIKAREAFAEKDLAEQLSELVKQTVRQLAGSSGQYQFVLRKKDLISALEQAALGPGRLGVGLPIAILAATGVDKLKTVASAWAGRLELGVSDDRMEIVVKSFDMSLYNEADKLLTADKFNQELEQRGFKVKMTPDLVAGLLEYLHKKVSLVGMQVARGKVGKGGKKPFLYEVYKEAGSRSQANLDKDSLDIREMQQRSTVKAGQLVARIKYQEPAVNHMDVFGNEVAVTDNEPLEVKVGDGIEQREPGYFYATREGAPTVADGTVSLSSSMVHEGDVNLRSGNIRFNGPVEIKGSIDIGSTVETSGDLIVGGSIRGGYVRAGGNIVVKGGITMGMKGKVRAHGDVSADFVENSKILAGGKLVVRKACINSEIVVGGDIEVHKGGLLAGGHVICRGDLKTDTLGFSKGAATLVDVGVDWQAEYAVKIRQLRIQACDKRAQDDRVALRELVNKKQAQMTDRHQEMKDNLQKRLQRFRGILEKLQAHLKAAEARLSYEEESKIYVNGTVTSNCEIRVGGNKIKVVHDVASVVILAQRKRGTHIHSLEEYLAAEKKALDQAS
jgi:uncharacterized protein (DUF342 family)